MIEAYAWLAIVSLAQAVLIALKIMEHKNGKKNNPNSFNLPCREHGNRITRLETMIEDMRDDIREIKEKLK